MRLLLLLSIVLTLAQSRDELININLKTNSTSLRVRDYALNTLLFVGTGLPGEYRLRAPNGKILFGASTTGISTGNVSIKNIDRDCTVMREPESEFGDTLFINGCDRYIATNAFLKFLEDMSSASKFINNHSIGEIISGVLIGFIPVYIVSICAIIWGISKLRTDDWKLGVCYIFTFTIVLILTLVVPISVNASQCSVNRDVPPCSSNEVEILVATQSNEYSSINVGDIINFKKNGNCLKISKQYTWRHCAIPGDTFTVSKQCPKIFNPQEVDCGPLAVIPASSRGSVVQKNEKSLCIVSPNGHEQRKVKCKVQEPFRQ